MNQASHTRVLSCRTPNLSPIASAADRAAADEARSREPGGRQILDRRFIGGFARLLAMGFTAWAMVGARAAEWSVKVADKAPPEALSAAFREILEPRAYQVSDGQRLAYEFWFVKTITLKSKPESASKALEAVGQTTPLGAVIVPEDRRDYRDKELFADTYTIRHGLQPQDGDHLGTSDYVYFMVLIPAKLDPAPDGITEYKPMVRASGKETPSGHPVVLSLRPVGSEEGEHPRLVDPAPDHKAVRLKLPGKVGDSGEAATVVFDLVIEGHSVH